MPLRDSARCAPVLIVLRFDYTSAFSIALLFGTVAPAARAGEGKPRDGRSSHAKRVVGAGW